VFYETGVNIKTGIRNTRWSF